MDTIHLWLVDTDQPASWIAELEPLLDEDERGRAGLLGGAQRRRFVVAHGAVRVIVGGCLGAPPERLRWRRGRHGKPELAGDPAGWQVSLSHSGDLAAVAVVRPRPVGVDIQQLPPSLDPARLAARYFPEPEARYVAAAPGPAGRADRFGRLWTRKEACLKAAGGRLMEGMRVPVRPASGTPDPAAAARSGALVRDPTGALPGCYRVRDVAAPPGFRAAVALAGAGPYRIVRHRWPDPSAPS